MRNPQLLAFWIAFHLPLAAFAQESQSPSASANPMTRTLQLWWGIAAYIVRAAEVMPEEKYSFKPFAEVRSFAEELGHVADEHFLRCSRVRGEPAPATTIEGKVLQKTDLVAKLRESVAYCDTIYETMTDANIAKPWQQGTARGINFGSLIANIAHDNEHASTIVMLMRMSGVTPPPFS